ncbi:type I-C CRISPR-associated protein Cas8c/Csd1 [Myxococcus sp. MISCRS1]|uniref:type I-C CRISPR-associated protein Cas8c/Csd1 n=1 Tax=Myxococcus sp. MISCRS1 TaxID=2996786 RepID=UPI002271A118|nr:type I-C CRISPR-associated protein Cas8c/Csd1 [Myxococcus sp. MISCRS1]MCY1003918.1 type I-C CRISPR-associated protein Cas8c/Csd1 [Myxococcus sp. MISCRS1]
MLLAHLYRYAEARGLLADAAHTTRRVHHVVRLSHDGRVRALESTGPGGVELCVPRPPLRSGGRFAAAFFVDNVKYVLGLDEGAPDKAASRVAAFSALARAAAEETRAPEALAVVRFLDSPAREQLLVEATWTGQEVLAFALGDGPLVHEVPALRAWWERHTSQVDEECPVGRCCVTGEVGPLARVHEPVKGLPGTSGMGARLVSFRAPSFESHGLAQGANAPIGTRAALGYVLALNHMLAPSETRHHRQGIRLGSDTVMVLWTDGPPEEAAQMLSLVDATRPELTRRALSCPLEPPARSGARLYAATLSGTEGRAVVRDVLEAPLGDVAASVHRFHREVRLGGAPDWPVPVWALLRALEGRGGSELQPDMAARLARCILTGAAFPLQILSVALERMAVEHAVSDDDALQLATRAGLLRAGLLRTGDAVQVALAETPGGESPAPFRLGRLLAVLEQVDGRTEFRARNFARCSTSPAAAFPELLRRARARSGQELADLVADVPSPLPARLDTQSKALFALGYGRERARQHALSALSAARRPGGRGQESVRRRG